MEPPIRMSMGNPCALRAYYTITRDEEKDSIKYRVGKALEPVVVQMLADNGLDVYFALDDQLEIAHDEPYRTGHPDGLVHIGDTRSVGLWLAERLPPDAVVRFFSGETAVLEVKTLNATNFRLFRSKGLDLNNSLMRTYYAQVQAYLGTLSNPAYDELWESTLYRRLLQQIPRPTWALVVAFAKGSDDIAMHVVDFDREYFERMNKRLVREVTEPMLQGLVPAPTYDGKNDECFWCDYRQLCPAARGVAEDLRSLDDLPLEAPSSVSVADARTVSLVARYQSVSEALKELERERDELRAELLKLVPEGTTLPLGNGLAVRHTRSEGRRSLDTAMLEVLAQRYGFDLPYKRGQPYSVLTVTVDKTESESNTAES